MKPTTSSTKSALSNVKSKRNSKDRDKRKSLTGTPEVNNHPEKELDKESSRLYAGIDADSLTVYGQQCGVEVTEDVSNLLTEDINYRLRLVINDSLIRARLSGRNGISSTDVERTFEDLNISKVYGATSYPNWVPFGYQNLYYLDQKIVNLVEKAEERKIYTLHSESLIETKWLPESQNVSIPLKKYFTTMSQTIVNHDPEVRKMALKNISENIHIGPIIEWFYNFGYILLSKNVTYDCLTMRALDLVRTLETSPICRLNVPEKQLQLLVRLILQRLLQSETANDVLRPLCVVLAILCRRVQLREFVVLKILKKLPEIGVKILVPVMTIINCLGLDAIQAIFVANIEVFLNWIHGCNNLSIVNSALETYSILMKADLIGEKIYEPCYKIFGDGLMQLGNHSGNHLHLESKAPEKKAFQLVHMKCELRKTRRILPHKKAKKQDKVQIEGFSEMKKCPRRIVIKVGQPNEAIEASKVMAPQAKFFRVGTTSASSLRTSAELPQAQDTTGCTEKLQEDNSKNFSANSKNIIVGKMSLSMFQKRKRQVYLPCDDSLLWYNL